MALSPAGLCRYPPQTLVKGIYLLTTHPARLAAIDQQYARDAATLARLVAVATAATRPNTLPASATAAVYDDLIDAMSPALVRRLLAVAVVELATRAATPVGPAQPTS